MGEVVASGEPTVQAAIRRWAANATRRPQLARYALGSGTPVAQRQLAQHQHLHRQQHFSEVVASGEPIVLAVIRRWAVNATRRPQLATHALGSGTPVARRQRAAEQLENTPYTRSEAGAIVKL